MQGGGVRKEMYTAVLPPVYEDGQWISNLQNMFAWHDSHLIIEISKNNWRFVNFLAISSIFNRSIFNSYNHVKYRL